jgi:hypothetical protein
LPGRLPHYLLAMGLTASIRRLGTVVVESNAKRLIKSLAWRVPLCLVLTNVAQYLIALVTTIQPTHADLIHDVIGVAFGILVSGILVHPFIRKGQG